MVKIDNGSHIILILMQVPTHVFSYLKIIT